MSQEIKLRYGSQVLPLVWGICLVVGVIMYLALRGDFGSVHGMWIGLGMFSLALTTPYAIYYSLLEIIVTTQEASRRLKVLSLFGVGSHSISLDDSVSISEGPLPNNLWRIEIRSEGHAIKIDSTMTGYGEAVDLLEEIGVLPAES